MFNIPTHITLRDPMNIRISTEDSDRYDMIVDEFTKYANNFQFTPSYRSGRWNGKICLMRRDGSLPYGLLLEAITIHKKLFPRATLIVDDDVKSLFKGKKFKKNYNLSLKPYPYQDDCIQKALKYRCGIIRSSTASGKSLIISYILKTLLENGIIEKSIIIVPNKSLVEQFYGDMKDYGISKLYTVGKVYQKSKQWDKNIVISTWQTLSKNHDKLSQYGCIIGDEVHNFRSYELKKIMKNTYNSQYRFGFTGTLHSGELDNLSVMSYIGPIIADYSSGELADQGYISSCNVKMVNIEYNNEYNGTYNEIKDDIFTNDYRLNLIKYLISNINDNILVLVGKVEKEGEYLEKWLKSRLKGKDVIFLSGRDDSEVREEWRNKMNKYKNICMIATYQIFSTGINIPSLKYVIFASPFKSKTRILQSVGRSLRKHTNKKDGSFIYDLCDNVKYLSKHSIIRFRYYDSEGFNIEEINISENNGMKNTISSINIP